MPQGTNAGEIGATALVNANNPCTLRPLAHSVTWALLPSIPPVVAHSGKNLRSRRCRLVLR